MLFTSLDPQNLVNPCLNMSKQGAFNRKISTEDTQGRMKLESWLNPNPKGTYIASKGLDYRCLLLCILMFRIVEIIL